ncbi:hypothetical protein GQ43DRAFT_438185 [Delitschia confertaspora ATCC 74209]|uniref:Large ribosomal subunit protein mL54 n=1 Tax=Delitschia confertaspora ATCC 74209 TaxID=1513339 RepID=A0A9P4JRU3_9PLEO|nr:hypothetical protein GQ43DRAFT_438185 [Delitschia confertaspora ATCC 74209]
MICRNCLRAAAHTRAVPELHSSISAPRLFSTSLIRRNATPVATPTATEPQSSQATAATGAPAGEDKQANKASTIVMSSVPAGTPLKGLNFLKNKSDPIAMEDHEYPSWLWDILKRQEKSADSAKEGDLFSKSKKQRRIAAKRLRKEQAANPESFMPKIPIYEQTVDLPAGDGSVEGAFKAAEAREELHKAMRVKRRAAIKEANFLQSMS